MMNAILIIVLLGAPGAGKGTVAQYLMDNYNVIHFSTGNLLRNEVERGTELGKKVKSILGSGSLVDDDTVNAVVESNILKVLDSGKIVLLDGYPRSIDQARFLDSIKGGKLKAHLRVIELDVDQEAVISRIAGRRVCDKCGATFGPSDVLEKCPSCSDGKLVKRADDNEDVVRKRLKEYKEKTLPVSEYYNDSLGRLVKVSGNGSREDTALNVDNVLRDFGLLKN